MYAYVFMNVCLHIYKYIYIRKQYHAYGKKNQNAKDGNSTKLIYRVREFSIHITMEFFTELDQVDSNVYEEE